MIPTWDNNRSGHAFIAKRIDRFIINASVIAKWGMPVVSTGNDFTSDHRPIFLEWKEKDFRLGYSFKFNRIFLEDKSFNDVITQKWKDLQESEMALFSTFREKIQTLRDVAKDWQILKRKRDKQELNDIKKEIGIFANSANFDCLTFEQKNFIRNLEKKKQMLLQKEEASWRLKSRATWLREGDRNSKFFHNFANARRRKNFIWKIEDGSGGFYYSQHDISAEATRYFQNQYMRQQGNINDILWAVDLVPEMYDEAANDDFFKPISEEELQAVIKAFKKDKSPGPDGWPIEFFSHFYDMFKADMLRMVEASRMSGNINSALTSTFIALIPKKVQIDSFKDYRPIALCNILFKIISKIIAERMKPVLNSFITSDQHAFLKDRNILDAVAMTQECLFSILSNNIDAAILKIDLKKAYDCVDWGFLRVLLAKIGLRPQSINWIMACV